MTQPKLTTRTQSPTPHRPGRTPRDPDPARPGWTGRLLPLLFEDEALLALDKPAGIDVGGDADAPPGLIELYGEVRNLKSPLLPVNRLSRYESGVLLLAKTPDVAEFLRTGLRECRFELEFVAVVHGRLPERSLLIGAERGASHGRGRQRWKRGKRVAEAAGRRTPTRVRKLFDGAKRSVVKCGCRVRTTHALRAQLRSLDLRVLGDRLHDRSPRPDAHHLTCLHLSSIAFFHPVLRRRVNVRSQPPPEFRDIADGARDVRRALHAALVRRVPLLHRDETDALRLLTGAAEDLPGVTAERYGSIVILQVFSESPAVDAALEPMARWYRDSLGVAAVYVKRFVKDRPGADRRVLDELHSRRPLIGTPAPDEFIVHESDLRFLIRPHAGFSTGLFLDHRDNRRFVRDDSAGKHVLNLFAYTCGFSVAAARGGAASVVSVDISPKHLDWGKANFAANGLEASKCSFIAEEAGEFLRRAARKGPAFDLVLIDPPTFAHGRAGKRDFSVTRDLPELLALAVDVLRPNGTLMVSTNCRTLTRSAIRNQITRAARDRRVSFLKSPSLPLDFAPDPDHAQTVFARLSARPDQ